MFIASQTTTSSSATIAASLRRLRSLWSTSMVQPKSSISSSDMQLVKQDTDLTSKSLISNNSRETPTPDSSLLSTTPEEIQRQLKAWREQQERLHIIV